METRRLEYFVTLIHEGTFRRAASALYISQPALSQQIQRLEQDIGAVLINRAVTPFELTPAGRKLFVSAQRILDELHTVQKTATRSKEGLVGKLKVGIAPSLMYSRVPGMIREFRTTYPDIDVSVHRESTMSMLDMVSDQRFDVGIVFSQSRLDEIQWATIYDDSFVAVLPGDHPQASHREVALGELRDEVFLMLMRRGAPDLHDAIISACARAGFSPKAVETDFQIEGAGYVDQIGLVSAGYGVAIIPSAVATLALPDIVYRPVVKPTVTMPTSLLWLDGARNPSISLFREFALRGMRSTE